MFPNEEQWISQGGCGHGCRSYSECKAAYLQQQEFYSQVRIAEYLENNALSNRVLIKIEQDEYPFDEKFVAFAEYANGEPVMNGGERVEQKFIEKNEHPTMLEYKLSRLGLQSG